ADSGNNVIRRITEDGQVETIGAAGTSPLPASSGTISRAITATTPLSFNAPTNVAVDALQNIFVTESGTGQVKTILTNGSVVAAGWRKTFSSPTGIVITTQGTVVVADSASAIQEVGYGQPIISNLNPASVSATGGTRVTVTGKNFAPESAVFVPGFVISNVQIIDSQTIRFTMPAAPSGLTTVTVQTRGGVAQASLPVVPIDVSALPAGYITTYAGGSTYIGDGRLATAAAT